MCCLSGYGILSPPGGSSIVTYGSSCQSTLGTCAPYLELCQSDTDCHGGTCKTVVCGGDARLTFHSCNTTSACK
jgi:hypothetical protein